MDQRDRSFPRFNPEDYRKMKCCPTCEGRGTHVNPSIDSNGISAEEMDEHGEEFRRDYISGVYDVRCSQCRGLRVVPDDEEYELDLDARYEMDLEMEAERRVGA